MLISRLGPVGRLIAEVDVSSDGSTSKKNFRFHTTWSPHATHAIDVVHLWSRHGALTGQKIAYIYPDFHSALIGVFVDGVMKEAQEVSRLINNHLACPLQRILFIEYFGIFSFWFGLQKVHNLLTSFTLSALSLLRWSMKLGSSAQCWAHQADLFTGGRFPILTSYAQVLSLELLLAGNHPVMRSVCWI